ncbi:Cuticular protein 50Cb [Carabus blaptoides fortunei]
MFETMFIVKMYAVALILCVNHMCYGLESRNPEVLLQPRNFNPHPYREGGRALQQQDIADRLGPVLFPTNPSDSARPSSNVVRVTQSTNRDEHPYANVARKQRLKFSGRLVAADQENTINPRVYSGLAKYAAKVLKNPSTVEHNGYHDPSLATEKKNYAFSYSVTDQETGDDFSHSQSQNAKATNGEYRVKLPDGRTQIVSYTADNNGYKANVKYDDEDEVPPVTAIPRVAPVLVRAPVPDYGYYQQQNRGQVTQLEVPRYEHAAGKFYQNTQHYVPIYPRLDDYKPNPHKLSTSQYLLAADKVQIYPADDGGQKLVRIGGSNIQSPAQKVAGLLGAHRTAVQVGDKFIASTVPSYAEGNILNGYEHNVLVSTVAPETYSPLYISTPKYSRVRLHDDNPSYYQRR